MQTVTVKIDRRLAAMWADKVDDCDRRVLLFLLNEAEGDWIDHRAIPMRLFNTTRDEPKPSMPERGLIEEHPENGDWMRITDAGRRALGHYGPMCRDPSACAGKGYCPRDPNCAD